MNKSSPIPVRIVQLALGFGLALALGLVFFRGPELVLDDVEIRVARDPSWPGIAMNTSKAGLTVLGDELLQRIGQSKGFQAEMLSAGSTELLTGLDQGKWDAAFTTVVPEGPQRARYSFSNPFYLTGPLLMVRADSNHQKLSDLENKPVGLPQGNTRYFSLIRDFSVLINPYDELAVAVDRLVAGNLEGVIAPMEQTRLFLGGYYKDRLRVAGLPLTRDGIRLVTRRGAQDELIEAFNDGLQEHIRSSQFRALMKKWGVSSIGMPPEEGKG